MADYGLQVRNVDGFLQIDGFYRNHEFWLSGSVYISEYGLLNFPAQTEPPLIFISATTSPIAFLGYEIDSLGRYVGMRLLCKYGNPVTISYQIFVPQRNTPSTGYGLQVFDESGKLAFDSGKKYLSIKKILSSVGSHGIGNTSFKYLLGTVYGTKFYNYTIDNTHGTNIEVTVEYTYYVDVLVEDGYWETVIVNVQPEYCISRSDGELYWNIDQAYCETPIGEGGFGGTYYPEVIEYGQQWVDTSYWIQEERTGYRQELRYYWVDVCY